jgi:ParB family transcriptional regulator, chromosome partitioning protein
MATARKSSPKKKSADMLFVDKIELIDIGKLVPWDNNPRNNDMAVEPIANSIKHYGMLVPLLINKKNEVIAGNTRLKACRFLDWKKVPCVRADHLSKDQQEMFNIADNKLGEIATWNQDMLKDILTSIQSKHEANFDPSLVGFQQSEMDLIFQGWNSNAGRMSDVESDDSVAPGKIVIECSAEDEEAIIETLNTDVLPNYEGAKIK